VEEKKKKRKNGALRRGWACFWGSGGEWGLQPMSLDKKGKGQDIIVHSPIYSSSCIRYLALVASGQYQSWIIDWAVRALLIHLGSSLPAFSLSAQ